MYCNNNPLSFVDPTGLTDEKVVENDSKVGPYALRYSQREKLDVYAMNEGKVTDIKEKYGSYGYTIFVEFKDGYTAQYSHLKNSIVKVGDQVTSGQKLGTIGNTSYVKDKDKNLVSRDPAFDPHLHLSLFKPGTTSFILDNMTDPKEYVSTHYWPTNTKSTNDFKGKVCAIKGKTHEGMDFSGWRLIPNWQYGLKNGFWKVE